MTRGGSARLRDRLGAEGRAALGVWGASRLGMIVLAWIAGWIFSTGYTMPGKWLDRWNRWDAGIFIGIARDGYFGPHTDPTHVAFFPGFPGVLWAAHLVARDWTAAGLAVSLVAGSVTVVALGRIAALEPLAGAGGPAAAPAGDFTAGGAESLVGAGDRAGAPAAEFAEFTTGVAADGGWQPVRAAVSAGRAPVPPVHRTAAAAANATLFFTLAPAAVFLTAGYSESLFAAFAFPAWYAARRDRWLAACLLAAAASAVRVNGLFLAAAIALEFVLAGRTRRSWRLAPLLVVPLIPVAGYFTYLRRQTGDWNAWQHAQAAGWFRTFKDPKSAWDETWRAAFGGTQVGHTAWVFQIELLAVVAGLLLTAYLLSRRRFPEALYVGLSLFALGTTTWFMSVPRAMLLWWPLWTVLGAWATRRPSVKPLYVCCVAPIMVGVAILFLSGQWAG